MRVKQPVFEMNFIKDRLRFWESKTRVATNLHAQIPLPRLDSDLTKLAAMFVLAMISTAVILPQIIKLPTKTQSVATVTRIFPNPKNLNKFTGILLFAVAVAAVTEKDWRR